MHKGGLYLLALLISTLVLSSCKSRKDVPLADAPLAEGSAGILEVQFGYMFVNACGERMRGNLQEALRQFEECRKIEPGNPAVNYEIAMIYKLLGDNPKAIKFAKVAADADPSNEWYQLLLIESYKMSRDFAQAVKIREALVKRFPARDEFREDLAIEYAIAGSYEKSLRLYEELEKTYGVNEQIILNKVKLLKQQNRTRDAEAELLKLSKSGGDEVRYFNYLAAFYEETGQLEKAKGVYDQILKINPADPTVNLALHDYYIEKNKPDVAFDHLKKAFVNPDLDVQVKTGITAEFLKKAHNGDQQAGQRTEELARMIVETHPAAADGHAILAEILQMQDKRQEAAREYWKAASVDKRDHRLWENLQYIDYSLGRFDSLERHSRIAAELFPSQPRFYLYNGLANSQLNQHKKAVRALLDGKEFVGNNGQLMLDFHRALGDAYHNLGEHEKSDAAFEEALKIDADNTYVLNNFAYYLSVRGEQLEKAEKLSLKSLQLKPKDRSFMDTYGWILYKQKRYAEAAEWLRKAASTGTPDATILEHYADALFRAGNTAEAEIQWRAAKKAGGDASRLDKKINEKAVGE